MPDNPLQYAQKLITAPALGSFVITPSDVTVLTTNIRSITINVAGTISWLGWDNVVNTTAILPVGSYPMAAQRINATGTTATGLTGWV